MASFSREIAGFNAKMTCEGKVYCRVSFTWLDPEEHEERIARRRLARQIGSNRFPCPHYISDQQPATRSMGDGKYYDSKSEMRKHYRRDGFIEVGNDTTTTPEYIQNAVAPHLRQKSRAEKDSKHAEILNDVRAAVSQTNLTSYRHEEIK